MDSNLLTKQELSAQDNNYSAEAYNQYLQQRALGQYYGTRQPLGSVPVRSSLWQASKGEHYIGESMFDEDIMNQMQFDNPMDVRAENQPWIAQFGAGLAKGALTFGTTYLNGNVGLVVALATGISYLFDGDEKTGFLTGFIDNPFLDIINAVQKKGEEIFPNYYSSQELMNEENGKWWKNFASGNFIGDKILKNAGFTIGALYSSAGISSALMKLAPKVPSLIRGAATTTLMAVSESSIDATSNINDDLLAKGNSMLDQKDAEFLQQLNDKYLPEARQAEIEYQAHKGLIRNIETNSASDPAYELYTNKLAAIRQKIESEYNDYLENVSKPARQKLADIRLKIAEEDFVNQLPVLLATEGFQWVKMFSSGFKTATRAEHITNKSGLSKVAGTEAGKNWLEREAKEMLTARGVGKGILRGAAEAGEEVGQKGAYEVPKVYYMNDVMNFYEAALDPDAEQVTMDRMNAFRQGWNNVWHDPTTSEEAFLGFIPGFFGVPIFGRRFTSNNNTWIGRGKAVGITGGLGGAIIEERQRAAQEEIVVNAINERVSRPDFVNYWQGLIRHQKYQTEMNEAVKNGDKRKWEDANQAQMISDIVMFDNAGKIKELKQFITEITDESIENIDEIIKQTTQQLKDNTVYQTKFEEITEQILDSRLQMLRGVISPEEYSKQRTELEKQRRQLVLDQNKSIGAFVDENGNPYDKEDIIDKIRKNKKDLLDTIDIYTKAKRQIDSDSEQLFTNEQLAYLSWLKTHTKAWNNRLVDMAKQIKTNFLPEAINFYKNQLETNTKLDDEAKKIYQNTLESLNQMMEADDSSLAQILKSPSIQKAIQFLSINPAILSKIDNIEDYLSMLADMPEIADLSSKYSQEFNRFMKDKSALQSKMDKSKNKIKQKVEEKLDAQKRKKIKDLADKFNWESTDSIRQSYEEHKQEIKDLGGEELFIKNLDKEQQVKYRRAKKRNKEDLSIEQGIDDMDIPDDFKRRVKALYENSEEDTAEKKLEALKRAVDNWSEETGDGVELTADQRATLEQVQETVLQGINNLMQMLADRANDMVRGVDINDKPLDERQPGDEKSQDDIKKGVSADDQNSFESEIDALANDEQKKKAKKANIESRKKGTHVQEANKKEFARPQISEMFLHGIDGQKYSEYLEEHKEAIPVFLEGYTYEQYIQYVKAIEEYLDAAGTFEYIKYHLKVGDKIEFFIDEELNQKAGQTVILMRTKTSDGHNQIIGSLPAEIDFNYYSKYPKDFDENGNPTSWEQSPQTLKERNPNRYKQFEKIISQYSQDKKDGVTITDKVYAISEIEKLYGGNLSLSSREQIVSQIFENVTPIIAVVKDGELHFSREIDSYLNPRKEEGQVYVFIPTNSGTYIPAAVSSTSLSDLSMDDKYITAIVDKMMEITSISRDQHSRYIKQLNKILRVPKGFTYVLKKKDAKTGKLVDVDMTDDATHARITIKGANITRDILIKDGKLDEKSLRNVVDEIKTKLDITTGVDINQITDTDYIKFISDYLLFNVNSNHSVNDWFTYKMATSKKDDVDKSKKHDKQKEGNSNTSQSKTMNSKVYTVDTNGVWTDETGRTLTQEELVELGIVTPIETSTEGNENSENKKQTGQQQPSTPTEASKTDINSIFGDKKGGSTSGTIKPKRKVRLLTTEREESAASEKHLHEDIERVKKLFPQLNEQDVIRVTDGLIRVVNKNDNPVEVYAAYVDGIFYISKQAPKGSLFHESFHYVIDNLLNERELSTLMQEAKKVYKTTDELETEEKLSESFRRFMNKMNDKSIKGFIYRMFQRIKRRMNIILNNRNSIDILFWDIYSNNFNGNSQTKDNFHTRFLQYLDTKYSYNNLSLEERQYLTQRNISKEEYENLSTKQREYLLYCM